MAITHLNMNNFNEVIQASPVPVIVDFYADWCQPCKRIAPVLDEIAAEKEGAVLVCKVNVDENQALAAQFDVMSIPNVVSFKNGEFYKRVVGVAPKAQLLSLVE